VSPAISSIRICAARELSHRAALLRPPQALRALPDPARPRRPPPRPPDPLGRGRDGCRVQPSHQRTHPDTRESLSLARFATRLTLSQRPRAMRSEQMSANPREGCGISRCSRPSRRIASLPMKLAPSLYRRAADIDESLSLFVDLGDDARALAAGQSVVPLMNLRMATPAALIDTRGGVVRKPRGDVRSAGLERC
jgi:hypothetical protein